MADNSLTPSRYYGSGCYKHPELNGLAKIYRESEYSCQVDHIIPLRGELVSGLHVSANLQILSTAENTAKGNQFEVV